ncbi:MAG TPA: FHA domain-containing protein, partial [Myxococcota bacterium]|nr:FHA domain-containing protein [Myxococcota bacterium]
MLAPTVEVTILRAGEVASRAQLAQGVFVIGRVDGCDIWLPDTGISRRHAILHIDTEGVWVEDCGSGNGTWYRGTRVQRQVIGDGDELLIEPFHLRFHLLAESTAEQTLFHGNSTTQQAVREIARLVGMGRLSGQEFQLSPERPIVLGRASSCDIVLPEPIASREHAELVWEGGAWWIRDNHSSNGTFVNGQRQREVALQSGDRIRIGALDFRFILDNPDGPDQLPTRHVPY